MFKKILTVIIVVFAIRLYLTNVKFAAMGYSNYKVLFYWYLILALALLYIWTKPKSLTDIAKLKKTAEEGDAHAQNRLGTMYGSGEGVKQDYSEAMQWFKLAADQNYAKAQNNLGAMYFEGQGVTKDYVMAYVWFSKASSSGHKLAQEKLDSLQEMMSLDHLNEAKAKYNSLCIAPYKSSAV